MSNTLIVATSNKGKLREMEHLLKSSSWKVVGLADCGHHIILPPETGKTFVENAAIKARAVWKVTGGYVLADDSGIECEDLEGAPGIYSARYAGPQATDEDNNQKLLKNILAHHDPTRQARYVCALVLINPQGQESVVEETCSGVITTVPSGTGGFGYDPYFYLPDKKCTMAELPLEEKNKISHRGKALSQLKKTLTF